MAGYRNGGKEVVKPATIREFRGGSLAKGLKRRKSRGSGTRRGTSSSASRTE